MKIKTDEYNYLTIHELVENKNVVLGLGACTDYASVRITDLDTDNVIKADVCKTFYIDELNIIVRWLPEEKGIYVSNTKTNFILSYREAYLDMGELEYSWWFLKEKDGSSRWIKDGIEIKE